MTAILDRPTAPDVGAGPTRSPRLLRAAAAPLIGLLSALVCAVGAGNPSYWGDEGASLLSAQRSWSSLIHELVAIDAVHGFYYALLHLWVQVAGTGEFAARFPSVVAAGFAAAGVVVLGRRLFTLRVGILSGVVLAVIPEFTRVAIEARSYSIDVAAAIWITVLLVHLLTRPPRTTIGRRLAWGGYAVAVGASVTMFELLALMGVVHVALVWALRPDRATVRRWAVAVGIAVVLALPIVVVAFFQRHQIAFLAHTGYATAKNVFVMQWFQSVPFAVAAYAAIVGGVAWGLRRRRRVTIAIVLWVVVPTATLLAVELVAMPMYNLRYPAFSLGGVAIAIAVGIDALARLVRWRALGTTAIAGVLAVLVVSAWPHYLAQRGPYAKGGGSDMRTASELLSRLASPGDAVVFDLDIRPSKQPGMALRLYPADFAGLDPVALETPYQDRAAIWDRFLPADQLSDRLAGHPVVWADQIRGTESRDLTALKALGYRITAHYPVHRTVLYRLERTSS